jgi:hypothetical protein
MKNKLVWQIENLAASNGPCFSVNLDKDFAIEMFNTKLSERQHKILNDKALERFKINYSEPFQFEEGTAFVKGFYLGENGVWLHADSHNLNYLRKGNLKENIEYSTHNVDLRDQTHRLIGLFDMWVYYSDLIKDWSKVNK